MAEPLPELLELSAYGGDWAAYEDALYEVYLREVVGGNHHFRNRRISYQFRPEVNGKGFGFWHLITTGEHEVEREPDLRRCERLGYVAWVLRNAERDTRVRWWKNTRGSKTRVLLWVPEAAYVVVLEERPTYYLLKTAYTTEGHRVTTFEREWRAYHEAPW